VARSKKWAYYNEFDRDAAAWLRKLIELGQIAPGTVDERSICSVDPIELRSFAQVHLFAGIGVWSYALRRAGWGDEREVWSGSCPCQPYSSAGKQDGFADERHLWPEMFRLVRELRPPTIFGEQVAAKGALEWWDLVAGDLEGADYAATAFDLPAASVGAPHLRSRLFWVADTSVPRCEGYGESSGVPEAFAVVDITGKFSNVGVVVDTTSDRWQRCGEDGAVQTGCESESVASGELSIGSQRPSVTGNLAYTNSSRGCGGWFGSASDDGSEWRATYQWSQSVAGSQGYCPVSFLADSGGCQSASGFDGGSGSRGSQIGGEGTVTGDGGASNFWDECWWVGCRDGKYRATGISIAPLASYECLDRERIGVELARAADELLGNGDGTGSSQAAQRFATAICDTRNWGSIKSRASKVADGLAAGVGSSGDLSPQTAQNTSEARGMRLRGYGNAIVAPLTIEFISAYLEI
jgi:DNA (cytosine-5)-methyltransferase 1